jgi:LPS-assembly protein
MKEGAGRKPGKGKFFLFVLLYLFVATQSFFVTADCFGEDTGTTITSGTLEYFADSQKYVATGSVKIEKEGAAIEADTITYYEATSDVIAEGNVRYDDKETSMRAVRADLNMEEKTGVLYDATVFCKKDNYHLAGKEIEKKGENSYYSREASFTTCDAPVPAWCFKGREVNTAIGDKITAKDTSFRIRNLPVLYTPYVLAPLVTERGTGFLMPTIGNSNSLGVELNIPFFWAISENMDATLVLDTYSKRGIGTGLEYRFLGLGGVKSNWWAYHIGDSELHKDFLEILALHEERHDDRLGGFLSINYVNEKDFFQVYSSRYEVRTLRFLESTGEMNLPFVNSRLYLLSQYRVDLLNDTGNAPQKLPEVGYVLNSTRLGKFLVSADLNAANFWEKDGISAGRVDLYPRVSHSIGTDFVVSETLALRETAYSFYNQGDADSNTHREAFEYDITGHTRLYRTYSSFTHVIEPSIGYHFIYSTENDLHIFDSAELFRKTSTFEVSLLNRAIVKGTEVVTARVTQGIDTYKGDGSFLPLQFEVSVRTPVPFTIGATYDVNKGTLETVTSDLSFHIFKANISVGERYNRQEDVMMYTASAEFSPYKSLHVTGSIWYDANGEGLRNLSLGVRYMRQCWGIRFEATKSPGDFSMRVKFDLAGLGSKASRKDFPAGLQNNL